MASIRRSHARNVGAALAASLAILLLAGAVQPRALAAPTASSTTSVPANARGLLTIDKSAFYGSVPPSATLGVNYTLRVLIQSNSNLTLPIIVRVLAPVETILVHPLVLRTELAPGGSLTTNFTIVPFVTWNRGPINVTAFVWIWFIKTMSTPALADQATAYVYDIGHGSSPYLGVVAFSAAVGVAVVALVILSRYVPRGGRG